MVRAVPGELKLVVVGALIIGALLVWGGPAPTPESPPRAGGASPPAPRGSVAKGGPPAAEHLRERRVTNQPERWTFDLQDAPANRFVTISNVGSEVVIAPRVVVNGERDWFDVDTVLAAVVDEAMSAGERALAIWRFLVDSRFHDEPAHPGVELHDPIRLLNVYGYGFCDDVASAFAVLCERAGVKARVTGLNGHVVAEAHYDGDWHAFDADLEVYYLDDDGVTIPSVEALHRRPELVLRRPSHRIEDIEGLAAMYASPNYLITEPRAGTHVMGYTLRPGESLTRSWSDWGLYFFREYQEEPAVYGNGRFRFRPSFVGEAWRPGATVYGVTARRRDGRWSLVPATDASGRVSWRFDSPYPLLDARVHVSGALGATGKIEVAFAVDDAGWRPVRVFKDPGEVAAGLPLRNLLRNGQGRPVYASGLRVTLNGEARLDSLTFERDVQLAPASLPALARGANEINYRDASPRRAVTVTFGYD